LTGRFGDWLAERIVRWRTLWFAAFCLVTMGSAWAASALQFDASYRIWFDQRDPLIVEYDRFIATFGSDAPITIAFTDDAGIFGNRALGVVQRISDEMGALPGVERIYSVTRHREIASKDAAVTIEPLVGALPLSLLDLEAARGRALADARVRSLLLSPDGKTTQVLAVLAPHEDDTMAALALRQKVDDLVARLHAETSYDFHVAGVPIIETEFVRYAMRDARFLLPLFGAFVVALLLAVYRTALGVVIPLVVSNLSVVITLGLASALGFRLNMLTMIVPQIVFAYGLSDGIHVYSNYAVRRAAGDAKNDAIHRAVRLTLLPCFLSSLATAIGFASLGVSGIRPIRETGILCALGVGVEYLVAFATFPTLVRLARKTPATQSHPRGVFHAIGMVSARRPWRVVVFSALVVVVGALGMLRLRVNSDVVAQFKEGAPLRRSIEYVDQHLTGAGDYEFVIDGGQLNVAVLRDVAKFEDYLRQTRELTHVISVVDVLKDENRALHGGDPAFAVLPESDGALSEMLLLLEGEDLDKLIDFDREKVRISTRVPHLDTRHGLAFFDSVRAWAAREMPERKLVITGKAVTFTHAQEKIARTFVESIAVSLGLVVAVIAVVFRSWRLALVSIPPSVAPIAVTMGFMGVAGIDLDVATAMVASIALGIAVDDTIHIFARFRLHGEDPRELPSIFRQIGFAMCWSSLLLIAGFSVFALSIFRYNANAGILIAVALTFGLLFDLLLSPALLHLVYRRPAAAP
jgi:predicted RND superfamily exporter protein